MTDPLINKRDPLHNGPEAEKALFQAMSQVSHGFSAEQVIGAAINVLVNAVRQTQPSRAGAIEAVDQKAAIMKRLLDHHYDGTGKRRSIFAHHQNIEMPLLRSPRK